MEEIVINDLVNTSICRLQMGVLRKESLETLFTINAPPRLYEKLPVRLLATQCLDFSDCHEPATKLLQKMDRLELERLKVEEDKRAMEELAAKRKENGGQKGKVLDVITIDDDDDAEDEKDEEKEKAKALKKKLKKQEKKKRLKEEKAVQQQQLQEAQEQSFRKKEALGKVARENSDGIMINGKVATRDNLPPGWNETMYTYEICYRQHSLKEFAHRLNEKGVYETWTAFYKRIFADEKARRENPKQNMQPDQSHAAEPTASNAAGHGQEQNSLPDSTSRDASPSEEPANNERITFRFPDNVWDKIMHSQ